MKKILAALALTLVASSSFAGIQEVMKDATGSGPSREQAIASALLIAAQSVNGTMVTPRVDMAEEVNMVITRNSWTYAGKSSPVFSVDTSGGGAISRFQVLSISGSGKSYTAKVRAYVARFQSVIADNHLRRMAVMPFQIVGTGFALEGSNPRDFSMEVADLVGSQLANSKQLSLVSRDFIGEMAYENDFLQWDGSSTEMARIGQKVGADYMLVGRISEARSVQGRSFYGAAPAQRESIRLNWRVIEVNTGKIAAAGTVNQLQRPQVYASLVNEENPPAVAEILSQQISNDVLNGLSLAANVPVKQTQPPQPTTPLDDSNLTPGSSEKPVKWQ